MDKRAKILQLKSEKEKNKRKKDFLALKMVIDHCLSEQENRQNKISADEIREIADTFNKKIDKLTELLEKFL